MCYRYRSLSLRVAVLPCTCHYVYKLLRGCTVPSAGSALDLSSGSIKLPQLLDAAEAIIKSGKTPLFLDNEEGTVMTFFSYGQGSLVDCKAIALAKMRGSSTEAEVEKARGRVVDCLKSGQTLVLALTNSAPMFKSKICEPTTLPIEIFDPVEFAKDEVWRKLLRHDDPSASPTLWPEKHTDFLREIHADFKVVLVSAFKREDVEEFLGEEVPLDKCQIIEVHNTS